MIAVASLMVLVGVIALSVVTKKNAGVIGLVAAYIFALIANACGTSISVSKIALEKPGHKSKSAVAKPVLVTILAT